MIHWVYGELPQTVEQAKEYFKDRIILSSTHEIVNEINRSVFDRMTGPKYSYYSDDSLTEEEEEKSKQKEKPFRLPPEMLNSLQLNGIPDHELNTVAGEIVMCIRNVNTKIGLLNGVRYIILAQTDENTSFNKHIIRCWNLNTMEETLIPRINCTSNDSAMPFKFTRFQFPIVPAFAITINKSQGQTFTNKVGIYLPEDCFSHGQLYTALSRSGNGVDFVRVFAPNNETTNVVFNELLLN